MRPPRIFPHLWGKYREAGMGANTESRLPSYTSDMLGIAALLITQSQAGRVMTFNEYNRIHHALPYILEVKEGKGRLVYFGIKHTRDPGNSQLQTVRKLWLALKPTLILNEDISTQPRATLQESVEVDGERGAVSYWAKQDHFPMRSIDLGRADEAKELDKQFPPAQVQLFYLIRGLQQELPRRLKENPHLKADDVAVSDLKDMAREGVKGPLTSAADIDKTWAGLHVAGDWRQPKITWIEPNDNGPLNRLSEASSELRDRHMVSVLLAALGKGEKVFAVVGASHVVMQEPTLRAAKGVVVKRKP